MTTHRILLALLASVLILAPLSLGQASVYAPGCSGLSPVPTVTGSGSLTPGYFFTVSLDGAPPQTPLVLIIGTINKDPEGNLLDIPLDGVTGMNPGCSLNTDVALFLVLQSDAQGRHDLTFSVPLGFGPDLNFQYAVWESTSPVSIVMSEALNVHIPLAVDPATDPIVFAGTRVGETSQQTLTLDNASDQPITVDGLLLFDVNAVDFQANFVEATPVVVPAGGSTDVLVDFTPTGTGLRTAQLQVTHQGLPPSFPEPVVQLSGEALGALGAEIHNNAGSSAPYFDGGGQVWATDYGFDGGIKRLIADPIANTDDDLLYAEQRVGTDFSYALSVPNGDYFVDVLLAEGIKTGVGERVFDVEAEGLVALDDVDIVALAGHDVAHIETFSTSVADGVLDLRFVSSVSAALTSGLIVRKKHAALDVTPVSHDFGFVEQGNLDALPMTLQNSGNDTLDLTSVAFLVNQGQAHDMFLDLDGASHQGDHEDVTIPVSVQIPAGGSLPATLSFLPTEHSQNDVDLVFAGNFGDDVVVNTLSAGGVGGHPFLHVVIQDVGTPVDYDGDGSEDVFLDGILSHTHEIGHDLTNFTWTEGLSTLSTQSQFTSSFALGSHSVCLEIGDDNVPQETLSGCIVFDVVGIDKVPGVLAEISDTGVTDPATLLDGAPPAVGWAEVIETFEVDEGATVGGSPFAGNTYLRLTGRLQIDAADTYEFVIGGGADSRLFVDGVAYTAPVALSPGLVPIEARFAITDLETQLPADVRVGPVGGPYEHPHDHEISHDETTTPPIINSMPNEGSSLGGNQVTLSGLGFFPSSSVVVHWGGTDLTSVDFVSQDAGQITLLTPPHSPGLIAVTVETPNGVSNSVDFTYSDSGPVAIDWTLSTLATVVDPTVGVWGPQGKFWVGSLKGEVTALEFDDTYGVTSQTKFDGVKALGNNDILGLAFDPFDTSDPPVIYVAHTELFAQGGGPFSGSSPYPGAISVLSPPLYDTPTTIITGLPTGNHDHGINGMQFDHNGDLLVLVGGNTNAGVKFGTIGDLPASPLSAALLKFKTSRPDFDGTITYAETATGTPNADQVFGEVVDVVPGPHVEIFSTGVRNGYDLLLTTDGRLFACDNGPNGGFGYESTGLTTDTGNHAADPDELLRLEFGQYYGHPNRNRGRYEARENVYHDGGSVPAYAGEFTPAIDQLSSSSNGIDEYRATTFQSQLRGQLLVQRWDDGINHIELTPDGYGVLSSTALTTAVDALHIRTGPGGAVLAVDYSQDRVDLLTPVDAAAVGLTAYDIFPWRAPQSGGAEFVIGGSGLGDIGSTTVTIGGLAATLTSVSDTRIHGTIPANPSATSDLLDVVVSTGGETSTLTAAFRYLLEPRGSERGTWDTNVAFMPDPVGEVGVAELGGTLYLIGGDDPSTMAYDPLTDSWDDTLATRPFPGDHHAVVAWNGLLYVMGGVGAGADGKVQIYDPLLDSWSTGADMPWAGGSCNVALIDDLIYVAGGFVGGLTTTDQTAVYDPALDTWTTGLADMVDGRNHAAYATDGERLWVFGGRGPGSGDANVVANGFADVQVYDPVLDTWDSSNNGGSLLQPLPIGRGGMGPAVYDRGRFLIIGGETLSGPGAQPGNVYDLVDVYDPEFNTWSSEAPLPTPRHGIAPILFEGRIWVLGGGTAAGHSSSSIGERLYRP